MFGYVSRNQWIGEDPPSELEDLAGLAKSIFEIHRDAMRRQGKASKLRYVDIGQTVYACMWPGISTFSEKTEYHTRAEEIQYGSSNFKLIELEKEELRTFDFFRTPQRMESFLAIIRGKRMTWKTREAASSPRWGVRTFISFRSGVSGWGWRVGYRALGFQNLQPDLQRE